jgi:hypothetical protein
MSAVPPPQSRGTTIWTWAAAAVAVAALAGSLYMSIVMRSHACPLCYYQRTFVMGVVCVLLVGGVGGAGRPGFVSLLALPMGVAGLSVAVFHVYREQKMSLEEPPGLLGLGSAPEQSLAVFVLLVALLLLDLLRGRRAGGVGWIAIVGAALLGVAVAAGGVQAVRKEYDARPQDNTPNDGARPPGPATARVGSPRGH